MSGEKVEEVIENRIKIGPTIGNYTFFFFVYNWDTLLPLAFLLREGGDLSIFINHINSIDFSFASFVIPFFYSCLLYTIAFFIVPFAIETRKYYSEWLQHKRTNRTEKYLIYLSRKKRVEAIEKAFANLRNWAVAKIDVKQIYSNERTHGKIEFRLFRGKPDIGIWVNAIATDEVYLPNLYDEKVNQFFGVIIQTFTNSNLVLIQKTGAIPCKVLFETKEFEKQNSIFSNGRKTGTMLEVQEPRVKVGEIIKDRASGDLFLLLDNR